LCLLPNSNWDKCYYLPLGVVFGSLYLPTSCIWRVFL
jgi:hypothetical protein